jgi:hypothetical protein
MRALAAGPGYDLPLGKAVGLRDAGRYVSGGVFIGLALLTALGPRKD